MRKLGRKLTWGPTAQQYPGWHLYPCHLGQHLGRTSYFYLSNMSSVCLKTQYRSLSIKVGAVLAGLEQLFHCKRMGWPYGLFTARVEQLQGFQHSESIRASDHSVRGTTGCGLCWRLWAAPGTASTPPNWNDFWRGKKKASPSCHQELRVPQNTKNVLRWNIWLRKPLPTQTVIVLAIYLLTFPNMFKSA